MEEHTVKKNFETLLEQSAIRFQKEVQIKQAIIDYVVELDNKLVLVEAKGDRSNIFGAIGQLVNAKRTCSHVFLLAPSNLIKKMLEIDKETRILSDFGFIEILDNKINILKKPIGKYYYKEDSQKIRKPHNKKNGMYVNEMDLNILSTFDNFLTSDIVKKYGSSYHYAQYIINRLKRAKLIEIANDGALPKFYKVIRKDVRLDEWIDFKI